MPPVLARETIPEHLPERLTISFWFGYWATDILPGEGFADLEQTFVDLVARGFNTVRIDGLWSWCFKPDGTRRAPIEIGNVADPGYCDYGAGTVTRGGGRVDTLQRLLELFALARKYGVYVALTSWEYQPGHTLGFVADPAIRAEILGIPVADRFDYTGQQIDRLLTVLKREGFADRIAYVEFHNEIEYSIGLGL
ncbi:MAG: cellulase-like family protein, partial [Armatimonadota bacterium]